MENVLEAKECYILMKKEYRISRNIRAEWYLNRINSHITISRKNSLNDFHGELEVISVLPLNPPPEWDSDTAHEYKYLVTEKTQLHFLSQKYRLVLCLDLSPSLSVVNIERGKVVFDEIFPTLEKCLKGVVRPFVVPGSQLIFFPKIYITIIAHTPFFKSQPQQVIVQGWLLVNERENMEYFLKNVHIRLIQLQNQLAQLTIEAYNHADSADDSRDEDYFYPDDIHDSHPIVSPDIGFVNMLRYGIVALQLLPQNSMAGIIVITDGVISLPDATMFDALLVQLRNLTISCSFLQIGTIYKPHTGLGYISFNDLMMFLANATFGVYFTDLPEISEGYENEINEYHKAFLTWGFQKGLEENKMKSESYFNQLPIISESSLRIRKQERKGPLRATLNAVLSCRLREGYTIKNVKICLDHIDLILVLAWKYSISIEYHIRSVWPPTQTQAEVQTEVWIEASYEFLSDISGSDGNFGTVRSYYRQRMVTKYLTTLQDLRETDLLLVNLQSFPTNPQFYTTPECVQKGMPVFYVNSQSSCPVPSSDFQDQYPQFANFWLPICMLNINKWQKWMHTHRIGVILKHETPLPRNLHVPNASGRYGTVHSQNSELTLTSFLSSWTDFILIENNSYIKFLFNNDEDTTPSSFFVVRITSNRPPCLAIRLAFLGGTSCRIRDKVVGELQRKIQQLTVRIRERSRERKAVDGSQKPNFHGNKVNSVFCCSITHKPIEKILIWHDRIPTNLFSSQVQETAPRFIPSFNTRPGTTNKSASDNQALLCRYLHHRRWIWGLQSSYNPPLSINAIMKILDTLTRMRLEEGFKFAYSRNGIVTMIKEFEMKLDLHYNFGGEEKHLDESDVTSHCMVQYIMFPPHYSNSKENLEEEGDEVESVEADGESQLITECWVEPQNGIVQESPRGCGTYKGISYQELASTFFILDQECIWGLLTFEYLSQICQEENYHNFMTNDGSSSNCTTDFEFGISGDPIQQIPFRFHLAHILPRCQRAEILLSTLYHDLYYSLARSTNAESDRANNILYSMILEHLNELHNNKQFSLSSYDNFNLPRVLAERPRDAQSGSSPFINVNTENMKEFPKWRCYLKFISQKHFLITILPDSFNDLKLLLASRINILENETNAIRMIDKVEDLMDVECLQKEFLDAQMEESFQKSSHVNNLSDRTYTSPTVHHDKKCSPSYQPQYSFPSTSGTLSSRSSSVRQDVFERSPYQRQDEKAHAQRQLFHSHDSADMAVDDLSRRTRYRSGPTLGNQMLCPLESLENLDNIGPRRGRAYSLHSNTDNGQPKKPRPSFATQTKDEKLTVTVSVKDKHDPWTFSGNEKLRKRNISMPSKCHKEMGTRTIYNKSLSVEAMKENELQASIFQDEESTVQNSVVGSPPQVNHDPIYGSVIVPIYCFDCRLGSIVNQYIKKTKEVDVSKDIFMNSTFSHEDNTPSDRGHSDPNTNTSHEAADKYQSPEPLSEESDTLASDTKCLKILVESIERCQRRSFVMGVFEALTNNLFVHSFDVQAALDQCQEIFLEIDITNFLEILCAHLKDFKMRFYMRQKRFLDTLYIRSPNISGSNADLPHVQRFPLTLLREHIPNDSLTAIHENIREKFLDILQSQFSPVPNMHESDYYYYSPKFATYSQAESNKYKYSGLQIRTQKKSEEESYNGEDLLESHEMEEMALFLEDEDRDKSIEFRSEDGNYGTGRFRYNTQTSQISQMSQIEYEDEFISEGNNSESGSLHPLFLHLTCTIRSDGHVIGTTSINSLPTCLGDIYHCIDVTELDISKISVSLDVLVMTLLGAADICSWNNQRNHLEERGRRTISGCSNASSLLKYSESITNSNSLSEPEEIYLKEEELLNHLPEDQHKAVLNTFDKIKWLIQDEIVSSLLHFYPVTEDMLQLVATHISDSFPTPVCYSENVPLKFVFGMERSMNKFMEEFKNLKITGYQLEKIGSFYYLAVPPDNNRLRNLFSLVPPLGMKTPTPDLTVKSLDHKSAADNTDSKMETSSGESVHSFEDGTTKRVQKVSFNTSTDSKRKVTDPTGTDPKKGEEIKREKWNRRRERKERRDSEKRGMPESSDSEGETSFVARGDSSQKEDVKIMMQERFPFVEESQELIPSFAAEDITHIEKYPEEYPATGGMIVGKDISLLKEVEVADTKQFKEEIKPVSHMEKHVEMLAPKPLELIRSGSINLPRTQGNKTEVIRKSASTDDFSPAIQDSEEPKRLHTSPSMWSEISRSKHSSGEVTKVHSDPSKSRHSSGGDVLKSRHNSGTGSVMGLHSDVSSLLESGQTTEDGCEGDISDLEDCNDWLIDLDVAQPPEFWIVIKINSDAVQTFFHCRSAEEVFRWKKVHEEVVRSLKEQIKLVNQRLLLQDLYDCRSCNHLLEPETSDDIWKHEDLKDPDGENTEYLEAAMKFKLGAFSCRQVWSKRFELHPRLKSSGKGGIKGIHTLKKTLNPFMVNNRRNMFVYEDSSGVGTNVFYLRLHEQQFQSHTGPHLESKRNDNLSRCSSIISLGGKRVTKDEDTLSFQGERRCFIDKDVIIEGVPSSTSQRRTQDFIVLTVHGIAEPGVAIKENFVQMLQKRLDDAVLDAICLMLWDNPHHKLTSEDVHFIQPPYQPPSTILKFSINVYALPYMQALCYYLRQNMISSGFTPPKYTDSRPDHHFQDFSATDQDPTTEANIFLFVCSQKSGTKGLACLAFSVVDSLGNAAQQKGYHTVNPNAHEDLVSETEFETMTQTMQQMAENETGAQAMFQFKVWESGRLDFEEMGKCLEEAIKHALWDLSMEYRFLVAPITPSSLITAASQPTTPIKGGSRLFGSPKNSPLERATSPVPHSQAISRVKQSVAEMGGSGSRRASLNVSLGQSPLLECLPKAALARSPSKSRHSVDFGKEHIPRLELRKTEDSLFGDTDSSLPDSSPEPLHSVFSLLMLKWFEYGIQMNVPTIKKHVVVCPTRSALPVFLSELQRWLQFRLPDHTTKFFKRNFDDTYTKIDIIKASHLVKSRNNEKIDHPCEIFITNRNEKEWWTILFEKDILEVNSHVSKGNKNKKFNSHILSQQSAAELSTPECNGTNSGYVSSPTTAHGLNSLSDSIPISQSQPLFRYGELYTSNSVFIHRQLFFMAILRENELTVYSYNWMKDLYEMLHTLLNRLCQWTFARKSLLSSLVLQKLGLFHNEPFVRKDCDGKDNPFKKDADKKEEVNPFVQNIHYIEGLIKSTYPGRDALGPKERSGRKSQNQTPLQNLSEVLRNALAPRPLTNMTNDLLQRHGMQMADVTKLSVHKEKERITLQSMIQSQTATTPVFTDITLSLFLNHSRMLHFCLTPLLFLPRWRGVVAIVRDYSYPVISPSPAFEHSLIPYKAYDPRARHESGASAKVSHLELRRSSSVDPSLPLPSPNLNRKRHGTLGGEDKWHDTLCLSYLKEFIHYLHCFGFSTLCIPETHNNSDKGSQGASNTKDDQREAKKTDDITAPTFLVRHFFGGTVIIQIKFVEPYFSAMMHTLEACRTQPRNARNRIQTASFIDEVELIRVLLHLHSFTYDYHLRAVSVYVADRQLLFARGYHLSSFLSDFIKYYRKSPNFARNLIHSGDVLIEDTGTSGEQLYNYLLAREKEYQMKVLRMTPIVLDLTTDIYTEFVLVHTKAYHFPLNQEDQREGDDYDVTLLVTHDTSVDDIENTLSLKFYVILTSRREMYPNRSPEGRKSGRFRMVSTTTVAKLFDNIYSEDGNLSDSEESPTDFLITASNSSTSSSGSVRKAPTRNQNGAAKQGTSHAKGSAKSLLPSIRDEYVNYLGYFSDYEMYMQKILQEQVSEARDRILHIFNTAKIHCRRDSLWQKLMWGLKEEERLKSSRDQTSNILSFHEFSELLTLVNVKSISVLDPQLLPLVSKPIHWYQGLARLLAAKYQDNLTYGTRVLTSTDGNIQHVVVYSLVCPDACIMITHNLHSQRADICCIRKQSDGSDELELKVRTFLQDFINCCCFHLLAGII